MRTLVKPTGVSRSMRPDQIIVSKTDPQGRFTYVNDVFVEIARYTPPEVLGRPHNVVRHPDSPRGLFKYLWDTISAGSEVFAYVNNLASDGANYWVLAHVTPSWDEAGRLIGYHSCRRAPSAEAIRVIQPIYGRMLAAEQDTSTASAATESSLQVLVDTLAGEQMTYDEFVWSVIESTR